MSGRCKDCDHWEFRWADDANERYGKCDLAYEGVGEAYPWSNVLLALEGPEHARNLVSATLLTHERFGCIEFRAKE